MKILHQTLTTLLTTQHQISFLNLKQIRDYETHMFFSNANKYENYFKNMWVIPLCRTDL